MARRFGLLLIGFPRCLVRQNSVILLERVTSIGLNSLHTLLAKEQLGEYGEVI